VLEANPNIRFSVSATTRSPRPSETDGKDYYFVSRDDFEKMIECREMLEHAQYVGEYYGTPAGPVDKQLEAGYDVLLDIEVQGAMQVRKLRPDAVLVFITPPSLAELRSRLRERGTDDDETIEKRVRRAQEEMRFTDKYDYVVINDTVSNAVKQLNKIFGKPKE
ncbi:MAG: guanylate kinase, partial [Oscillospiraceae bacterium]|jgi:guanylate kinase